jgi:hypothetical protein
MSDSHGSAQREIDIDRKVAFLGSLAAYGERPRRVERIETHFSWVFLTDRHVYKLKKPLRGEGFDFSSSAARQRNAEAEVHLNRRLASEVYIGVVPLTLEAGCDLAIAGQGVVIDWLVKMVRLPAGRMRGLVSRRYQCPRRPPRPLLRRRSAGGYSASSLSRPAARRMPSQSPCVRIRRRSRTAARSPVRRAPRRSLHLLPQRPPVATAR